MEFLLNPYIFTSGGSQFKPTDVVGCQLWLDAEQGITQSSGYVSQWNDMSLNGNDAIQATGTYQPLLITSAALNNKNVIRFDGSNDNMVTILNQTFAQPFSIFVVWTIPSSPNTFEIALDFKTYDQRISWYNNVYIGFFDGTHGIGVSLGTYSPSAFSYPKSLILVTIIDGLNTKLYENGVIKPPDSGKTPYNDPLLFPITLGSYLVSGIGYNANIDIAEIVIYNSALSDIDRRRVETYLKNKYNL